MKLNSLPARNATLFLVALGIRLLFLAFYPRYDLLQNEAYMGDALDFHGRALLYLGQEGELTPALSQVAPVYPAFLAVLYALFGQSFVMVRVVQCVLGALTCLVVRKAAHSLWGRPIGVLSGYGLALYYPHLQLSGYVGSEMLYTFVLCVSAFSLARIRKGNVLACGLSGLLLWMVAVAIRPVAIAFFPGLFAAFLYGLWLKKIPVSFLLKGSAVLVSACSLWVVSVFMTSGRTVPFVIQMGQLLYEGNSPHATGGHGGHFTWDDFKFPPGVGRVGKKDTDRRLFALAIEHMKEHPFHCVSLAAKKTWNMWRPYHADATTAAKWIHSLSYLPLCLGAVWTLFIYKGSLFSKVFLSAPLLSGAALHAVLIGQIRYRYPLDPFLLMLAAPAGWTVLRRLFRLNGMEAEEEADRATK